MLPPQVQFDAAAPALREYWRSRVAQHTSDSYAGVPMSKFPEDLRVYEHLLWLDAPDTVIEIGTQHGASALWFRDRLRTLQSYGRISRTLVVSIDVDLAAARRNLRRRGSGIVLVEGDVRDEQLRDRVEALVPGGSRCLVIEDSAHEYDTTWAALAGFAPFVPAGGFMVVEDGCVDIDMMRLSDEWPRGVLPALNDWLATDEGACITVRRDLELYGLSCHPSGFLQRALPFSSRQPRVADAGARGVIRRRAGRARH